jgi:hypothetical protein
LDILDKLAGCLASSIIGGHRNHRRNPAAVYSRAGSEHPIATRLDDADHGRRICGEAGVAVGDPRRSLWTTRRSPATAPGGWALRDYGEPRHENATQLVNATQCSA